MKQTKNITQILSNPRYRGKHVILIGNSVFTAKTDRQFRQVFDRVMKKFPGKRPTIAYVPKADSLILIYEV